MEMEEDAEALWKPAGGNQKPPFDLAITEQDVHG